MTYFFVESIVKSIYLRLLGLCNYVYFFSIFFSPKKTFYKVILVGVRHDVGRK